jgi:predicted transcriptional regulator
MVRQLEENEDLLISKILRALKDRGATNAGDIVNLTGLPRYYVLAAFQVLHELGYVELIYSKGSHKVYRISNKGTEFLENSYSQEVQQEKAEAES